MLVFSFYHAILIMSRPGGYLCKSLLSDGNAGPDGQWRPSGCMTHVYSYGDAVSCVQRVASWTESTRIYFVGDTRLLVLFHAFAAHFDPNWNRTAHYETGLSSKPISLIDSKFTLCFFSHDEVTSETIDLFNRWNETLQNDTDSWPHQVETPNENVCFRRPPTHLVISMATGIILRYKGPSIGSMEYEGQLKRLVGVIAGVIKTARVVWMLQDPVAEGLLSGQYTGMTNKEIDRYNQVAQRVIHSLPEVEQWSSNRLIAQRMGFPAVAWYCSPRESLPLDLSASQSSIGKSSENGSIVSTSGTASHIPDPSNFSTSSSGSRSSELPACKQPPALSDGFHVSDEAMARNVQVLLNLYCNNQMRYADGTCCRSPEPITATQKRCFIFIGLCIGITFICFLYHTVVIHSKLFSVLRTSLSSFGGHTMAMQSTNCFPWLRFSTKLPESNTRPTTPINEGSDNLDNASRTTTSGSNGTSTFADFYDLMLNLSNFGLILVYFFICDRTAFFMNTNKGYTAMSFVLPLAYCLVLGIFFCGSTSETRLMHIDVTREWKGWMQVYLLIYHFTGSYRVHPLFVSARFLISAYLFLSGFGHFHFMWFSYPGTFRPPSLVKLCCKIVRLNLSMSDLCAFGQSWWLVIHRYIDVMFRLNFFVMMLCLMMNRDYVFYYFMPLVSFWFTVTLFMVSTGPYLPVANEKNAVRASPLLSAQSRVSVNFPVASSRSHHNLSHCICKQQGSSIIDPMGCTAVSSMHSACELLPIISPRDAAPIMSTSRFLQDQIQQEEHRETTRVKQWRKHHKASSLGTVYDLRTWQKTGDSTPLCSLTPDIQTESISWLSMLRKHSPPWTDQLLRRSSPRIIGRVVNPARLRPSAILQRLGLHHKRSTFCQDSSLRYGCFLCKILVLIVIVELVYQYSFEGSYLYKLMVSGPQRHLFQLNNASRHHSSAPFGNREGGSERHPWFYYWSMDRYTAIFGMLFALLCNWIRSCGILTDDTETDDTDLGWPVTNSTTSPISNTIRCKDEQSLQYRVGCAPILKDTSIHPVSDDFDVQMQRLTNDSQGLNFEVGQAYQARRVTSVPYTRARSLHSIPLSRKDFSLEDHQYHRHLTDSGSLLSKITCRRCSSIFLTVIGLLGILIAFLVAQYCRGEYDCADLHAYFCILPIASFVLFRNCLGSLRRYYSTLFAWIGDISLELSVAQCHIWMSADARGILVLLPGYPLVNLALTSFVFVCICHEVNRLTSQLRRLVIPPDLMHMLRNIFIFGLILYPITSSDFLLSLIPGGVGVDT